MDALECKHDGFIGGGPPFLTFELQYHLLFDVVESHKADVGSGPLQCPTNPAADIALIGLVANFEAFCKHHFAALIAVDPWLVEGFARKRPQATLTLADISLLLNGSVPHVGSLIADKYEFGSASDVNALFRDLVCATPFSKEDALRFDGILSERHLLVHHAGVYSLRWLRDASADVRSLRTRLFQDRIALCTEDYHKRGDFIFEMAMKVAQTTVKGAQVLRQQNNQPELQERVYASLLIGLYDSL
jgi:hypothetical protein